MMNVEYYDWTITMLKRVVLFGLPRCGSQYIAELIKENSDYKILDLIEPYTSYGLTESDDTSIIMPVPVINKHNVLSVTKDCTKEFLLEFDKLSNISNKIEYINNTLMRDTTTPIVLRLFPYDYLLKHMPTIVEHLRAHGFSFLVIKRTDVEKHLLSYMIAQATNKWSKFDKSEEILNKVVIDSKMLEISKWLANFSMNFMDYAKFLKIDDYIIEYENAVSDLSKIYQKSFVNNVKIYKQGLDNPYDQIINSDEVKEFTHKLLMTDNLDYYLKNLKELTS